MPINDIDELHRGAFGSRIFVQLEKDLWHERFFLGIGEAECLFIGTPDGDVYEESWSDCLWVQDLGGRGGSTLAQTVLEIRSDDLSTSDGSR